MENMRSLRQRYFILSNLCWLAALGSCQVKSETVGKKLNPDLQESPREFLLPAKKTNGPGRHHPNWMTRLDQEFRDRTPLNEITMQGSHDAASYGIGSNWTNCNVGETVPWYFRYAKKIVSKLARTQELDIFRQLYLGVRYFDIRLCTKKDGQIYIHHGGYVSVDLDNVLEGISAFLSAYPDEVLIFHVQRQFFNTVDEHRTFIDTLKHHGLWKKLASRDELSPGNTLSDFQDQGKSLIVIHDLPASLDTPLLWKTNSIKNPWANSVDVDETINYLEDKLNQRNYNHFFVFQSVLTPNEQWIERTLKSDPLSIGIDTLSESINQTIVNNMENSWRGDGVKRNIILSDMVHYPDLTRMIIESNR